MSFDERWDGLAPHWIPAFAGMTINRSAKIVGDVSGPTYEFSLFYLGVVISNEARARHSLDNLSSNGVTGIHVASGKRKRK